MDLPLGTLAGGNAPMSDRSKMNRARPVRHLRPISSRLLDLPDLSWWTVVYSEENQIRQIAVSDGR